MSSMPARNESGGERFDTIVLDPRPSPKSRQRAAAMRGYKEINLRALKLLNPVVL